MKFLKLKKQEEFSHICTCWWLQLLAADALVQRLIMGYLLEQMEQALLLAQHKIILMHRLEKCFLKEFAKYIGRHAANGMWDK